MSAKARFSYEQHVLVGGGNTFGMCDIVEEVHTGWSKRPDIPPAQPRRAETRRSAGKAAASEEARRYVPHFVGPFALVIDLGERKSPSSASDFRATLVEPLSDARTKLADFFSLLLQVNA